MPAAADCRSCCKLGISKLLPTPQCAWTRRRSVALLSCRCCLRLAPRRIISTRYVVSRVRTHRRGGCQNATFEAGASANESPVARQPGGPMAAAATAAAAAAAAARDAVNMMNALHSPRQACCCCCIRTKRAKVAVAVV